MDAYCAKHSRGTLIFRFPYDAGDVAAIKAHLPGARWDPDERGWVVTEDLLAEAIAFAEARSWDVLDDVCEMRAEIERRGDDAVERAHARMSTVGEALYAYQPRGVRFLVTHRQALLAWDQRTGKTVVSAVAPEPDAPLLVLSPAGVKYQWLEEINRFRPEYKVEVLRGRGSFRWPTYGECVIVNYEILPPALKKGNWIRPQPGALPSTVFLVDEAHLAKNPKAKRTQSVRSVARGVMAEDGWVWFLTATPLSNTPLELWNLLATLGVQKTVFGSFAAFMDLFNARKVQGQIVWGLPKPQVRVMLDRVMDRVSIQDVLGQAPPFLDSFLPVDVTAPKHERLKWARDFTRWKEAARQGVAGGVLEDILGATRVSLAQAKIPALLQLVAEYERDGVPVVVYSAHRAPVEALMKREGWDGIIGNTTSAYKNRVKRDFQKGRLKGVASTIRAGALGITLNRAREMIFVDLDWSPGENAQAMMRCVSVEQADPVRVRILTAAGTADVDVLKDQERKTRMVRATLLDPEPPPRRTLPVTASEPPRRRIVKETL